MVTTYNNFWKLWYRALIVSAIMYCSFIVLCFIDTLIKNYRKRGGYSSINSTNSKQKERTLAQTAFDIPQMWWHSLASVIDITFIILFNKYVARPSLKDLGYPAFNTRSRWIPNPKKNLMRLAYVLCICAESHWRGFTRSIYGQEDRKSPVVVYIILGSVYAGVHALNNGSSDIGVYSLVLFNIISEGALWYGLYSTTHNLTGNWYQHDIDDLFSIWFGATALAGYALPAGQIALFYIKCKKKWILGGDFGPGGSIIYIFQNPCTLCVILTLRYIIKHYNTALSQQDNKTFTTDQDFEEDFLVSDTFE
ncbi:hypothetical protein M0812_27096 [Anaeramoeba flamelloides]|uniref:Uncharacterized protein n=1 Tax=Anaeramoeba flamelloides TaxID=1746091 RepID=A0AAV7YJ63_9EUKA|nr:hypothetical protein M0812_27096 [Anaeramoeba flamelloides]